MSNGSWQADPYGRHQLRWWDGTQWTQMVSDNGVTQDESAMLQSASLPPPHLAAPPSPAAPWANQPLAPTPAGAPKPKRTRIFVAIGAVVVIVAAVVVVLVTRGGGGGSSARDSQTADGKKYVAAMVASADQSLFKGDEAKCVADGTIDIIGVKTLQDAGVTPDDLANNGGSDLLSGYSPTTTQANDIIDLMFKCVDFGRAFADQMGGTGLAIPTAKLHCVGDELEVNKVFRAYLLTTLLTSDTSTTDPSAGAGIDTALSDIFTKCGINLADLSG